jgi:hypothetical protein
MYPPLYATCAADSGVQAVLTDTSGLLRLYPFGEAPQQHERPYAVWQTVYGEPYNSLSCPPDVDQFGVQIDVYGPTADSVRTVAAALRAAIEPHAYIVRFNGETRESATRAYRYSFDVEWQIYRA